MFEERGVDVHCMGKPYRMIFDMAMKKVKGKKVVMIGDTPDTDIRGAHLAGLDGALVTKTGNSAAPFANDPHFIEELPVEDQPEYILERLGL